ncbi:hypothetical protein [Pandoraea sp. PE-S2R-1]|uniref:hypothetical protein n=1 Tax=Pandoraea sp. PE-S2R-1 TaxID=1986994 RepID=UPI001130AA16|nr:hypothetical protein [Pandoraea sp. PE-S2R-1]
MMPLSLTASMPPHAAMPRTHPLMPPVSPAVPPAAPLTVSPQAAPATTAAGSNAHLAALARQPLAHVLSESREGRIRASLLTSILSCAGCAAADELLALCAFASREGQTNRVDTAKLRTAVISLLTRPATARTFEQLRDTGMFCTAALHDWPSRDNLDLLFSDEGLLLWLRYGATPDGYQRLFVDHLSQQLHSQVLPEPHPLNLGQALRVLVAVGRDTVVDVPDPYRMGHSLPPLSHLCATHAPDWLPFLLDISPCASQCDSSGRPLLHTALASATRAARAAGATSLEMNRTLQERIGLLTEHGADLCVVDLNGMPLAAGLVVDGYIDAARVVLQFGAPPQATDREMNSVLHHLARTLRPESTQYSAAIIAIVAALAAGADVLRVNARGETAIDLLPEFQRTHFIFLASHYARWTDAGNRG